MEDDDKKTKSAQKPANKKKSGAAWLREGGEEDFVDFLDPSMSKKVLGEYKAGNYLFVWVTSGMEGCM